MAGSLKCIKVLLVSLCWAGFCSELTYEIQAEYDGNGDRKKWEHGIGIVDSNEAPNQTSPVSKARSGGQ